MDNFSKTCVMHIMSDISMTVLSEYVSPKKIDKEPHPAPDTRPTSGVLNPSTPTVTVRGLKETDVPTFLSVLQNVNVFKRRSSPKRASSR